MAFALDHAKLAQMIAVIRSVNKIRIIQFSGSLDRIVDLKSCYKLITDQKILLIWKDFSVYFFYSIIDREKSL